MRLEKRNKREGVNEKSKRKVKVKTAVSLLNLELTVAAVLNSDWCQKTFVFFCPIKFQNGGDRLELVW